MKQRDTDVWCKYVTNPKVTENSSLCFREIAGQTENGEQRRTWNTPALNNIMLILKTWKKTTMLFKGLKNNYINLHRY